MTNEIVDSQTIERVSDSLYRGVAEIIDDAKHVVVVYVNKHANLMFWHIGHFINEDLGYRKYSAYGDKIIATLSQTLTWSHFLELISIEDGTKRLFYQQMGIAEHWSVRQLRDKQDQMVYERSLLAAKPEDDIVKTLEKVSPTHMEPDAVLRNSYVLDFLGLSGYYSEEDLEAAIAKQLEAFILELGQGFAFLERQKRFSIDGTDYYLDMLFYHRKLKCLVAIDLKLGKFNPQYKGQMELYLKYLQKNDMQPDENPPIGLLLCSEGNTEHIELMMLNEDRIKVAQYLTCLPNKQWFIDKLNRSILIAKEYNNNKE